MIDWYSLGFSAIWIVGLGFVTAGLSMAYFIKSKMNLPFRKAINIPSCRIIIGLGLVFFCLGLAGGMSTLWEHILWIVLALVFGLQTWVARNKSNS
jgi:hypothetical protein